MGKTSNAHKLTDKQKMTYTYPTKESNAVLVCATVQ
jgi:hypothetical protein